MMPKNLLTDTSDNQDYSKSTKGGETVESKEISSKSMDMIKGGGTTSDSGPTSSSRSYPKGKMPSMTPDFNPMKAEASTYGINGVGKGES